MNRVVRGSDGREWTVKATLEWSNPISADEFEHDVTDGSVSVVIISGALVLLAVMFVMWTPPGVIVPPWLVLLLIAVALFFPVRWLLRRPWTVTAATLGDEEKQAETWVGVVRGFRKAHHEVAVVSRHIELHAEPDMNGELQPVE
ncbi:hypothetical protein [Saccharopolyspora rectivirgula]|jgi:hypothetical protein|uniref:DUF983 domain-containing protein n=1 Tax=Saccharopolyspora rectivirgula TaxID=28042 RepID=A0A073AYE0_9PSEU|nr:hypothetical protein [Saccharopolyspora rectivirgula]KEI44346.1 hypothetical protein GU90_10700 [Saccharopolyspora rectivirgula]